MKYRVKKGDCISSIADKHGFRNSDSLWNHPENAELKEKRKNKDILMEGDFVYIPEKGTDKQPLKLGQYNTFTVPVLKTYLRLRLLNAGEPRANEKFSLKLLNHSKTIECETDADGKIEEIIPNNLKLANFKIGKNNHSCILMFGVLHPKDNIYGVRGRLKNLHFHSHVTGSKVDSIDAYDYDKIKLEKGFIENSTKRFQLAFDKDDTGKIDDELKTSLEEKHEKDQSWKCEPKEGEIPYKLPNRKKFVVSRNTWNTIDIVDSPDIVLDGHMHIQSANCAPMPLTWNTLHRVALQLRLHRSTLQDKVAGILKVTVRALEWSSNTLPDIPLSSLGAPSSSIMTQAGADMVRPVKDLIEASNKKTSQVGDDVIKKHRATFKEFQEEQPEDNLSSMIVMPMDMDFAHIGGYDGDKIYEPVSTKYYLKIPAYKKIGSFHIERAVGKVVEKVKEFKSDQIEQAIKDESTSIYFNSDRTHILLSPDAELSDFDEKDIRTRTGKFYYSKYKYDKNLEGELYWMAEEEHRLYEPYDTQIQHTLATAAKYPFEMIPMYHYDPRRWQDNWEEPFNKYFKANEQLFIGLKMYTALGYKPMDKKLWKCQEKVYAKCVEEQIPILCHCTPEGMSTVDRVMYAELDLTEEEKKQEKDRYKSDKKSRKDGKLVEGFSRKDALEDNFDYDNEYGYVSEQSLQEDLVESHGLMQGIINKVKALGEKIPGYEKAKGISIAAKEMVSGNWKKHYFRENYVAPKAWAKVLEKYGDLRLCLAHFGGDAKGYANWNTPMFPDLWDEGIIELIKTYNHVYTDISFFYVEKHKDNFIKALKDNPELLERIIFGTDWFLIIKDGVEYQPYCEKAKEIIREMEEELQDDSLWLRFTRINPMRFYRIKENAEKLYNGWETSIELANEGKGEGEEELVNGKDKGLARPIREKNYKIIQNLRL